MAQNTDIFRLSSPRIFLVRMLIFLALSGFIALILYQQIEVAFFANPGLNGLIIGVLVIGIVLGIRQVVRLFPEIAWVNALDHGKVGVARAPVLLAPMASLLGVKGDQPGISTATLRVILDSIGSRLDEARETARYLTGLLIFLGLLGTFWGLLQTVHSISDVIGAMQTKGDSSMMFDDLKNGLRAPIAGMSVSFTSSLFGLAGSLVLGFLDLQAGQAQNRFYNELEDRLTGNVSEALPEGAPNMPMDVRTALAKISAGADQTQARASAIAMANLAEGIQGLVQHMRNEQQQIRDWVEAQATQQVEIRKLLERLARESERP
ncbi:MAG: flagellar motor protein MotA [Hyphomicrobiales bacterium]|nr:flagellar motor protein MotA [Hyphomicrobiales bacterium]MDE2115858.1 flagellar motor protein MotA [Hyphomicrobiales bacterium]